MRNSVDNAAEKSPLEGLWLLLVANEGQVAACGEDGRVPMMARTGNDETYLLGFKNMSKAREFMNLSDVRDAEPRMVVRANKSEYLRIAHEAGATGILVDYNPATQKYALASELY